MAETIRTAVRLAAVVMALSLTSACGDDGGSTSTADAGPSCPRGTVDCAGSCVSTQNDPANCGACGTDCPSGDLCSAGTCASTCMGGTTECGTACVNTTLNPQHCGGCDVACATGEVCSAGACGLDCSGGTTKCVDACVDTDLDPNHCGACGTVCGTGEVCSSGVCALGCGSGTVACDGTCVDTDLDPAHCGGCTTVCDTGEVCSDALCGLECSGGTTLCGTACVDTNVDPAHCGNCVTACGTGEMCSAGGCAFTCVGGTTQCGSDCADTSLDENNCGACGTGCSADQACEAGVCAFRCRYGVCGSDEQIWSWGYSANDVRFYDVAVDSQDNIIVVGIYQGVLNVGGGDLAPMGNWDSFVAKYNSRGQHIWSAGYGGSSDSRYYDVEVDDSDNIVIAGFFRGSGTFGGPALTSSGWDAMAVKYDEDGAHIWSRSWGSIGTDYAYGLAVDDSANIYLTGLYQSPIDFGGGSIAHSGSNDVWIMKMDADANHIWSRGFGDASAQEGFDVDVDSAGNVYMVGYAQGTVNFGGSDLVSAGSYDNFIAKFDSDGVHIWSQREGDAADSRAYSMAIDSGDNVVIGGMFTGSINYGGSLLVSQGSWDGFLAKLDRDGGHLWSKRYGNASDNRVFRIASDANDTVHVSGLMQGTMDFGPGAMTSAGSWDAYYAKVDADGNGLHSANFGDGNDQQSQGVAVDSEGRTILVGIFRGRIDLGWGWYMSLRNYGGFVGSFAP